MLLIYSPSQSFAQRSEHGGRGRRGRGEDLALANLAVCAGRPPASLHHGPLSLNRCAQAAGHEAESAPTPDPDVVPEQTGSGTKIGRHRPSATSLTSGARPDLCRPQCGSGRSIQRDGGAPPAGLLSPEPHAGACLRCAASHTFLAACVTYVRCCSTASRCARA